MAIFGDDPLQTATSALHKSGDVQKSLLKWACTGKGMTLTLQQLYNFTAIFWLFQKAMNPFFEAGKGGGIAGEMSLFIP